MTGPARYSMPSDVMTELQMLAQRIRDDNERLPSLVAEARSQGWSWTSIALMLGISRQAAWERYSR